MLLRLICAKPHVTDVECASRYAPMKYLNFQEKKLISSEKIIAWNVEPAP